MFSHLPFFVTFVLQAISMVRNILSIASGLLTSFVLIILLEAIGHILYPPPADLDIRNAEAYKEFLSHAPMSVFLLVLLAYALGSFFGGMTSSWVAKENKAGKAMTVGGILMGLGMVNLMSFQHPVWVVVAGFFAFLPFSYLGGKLGIRFSKKNQPNT